MPRSLLSLLSFTLLPFLFGSWARGQGTPASQPTAGESQARVAPAPVPSAPAAPAADDGEEEVWGGDLFELGQSLFEQFAPEEIKERYRFPTREDWDNFAARLQLALESNSMSHLAEMEPEARAALAALRALPDYAEYADWLEERLDDISVAQQVTEQPAPATPARPASSETKASPPTRPTETASAVVQPSQPTPPPASALAVPLYDVWLERMQRRPPPARAANLVPRLKPVFTNASVPAALVWLAETESSFNPAARSPVGARGLFQLMPGTAKDLGLRLLPFDERLDPMKSAHSAARYLSRLHNRFQDWPLTLAAYNAGPNRVSRLLKEHQASTFAEIADVLPSETRLYVPKVLATLAVREGVNLVAMGGGIAASE